MRAAQAGNSTDYAKLLAEISVVLERYITQRFGAIDALEDCIQECLIAIHQARHTYDVKREFRPWMFTLARHKVIDSLRQRSTWLAAQQRLSEGAESLVDTEQFINRIDGAKILQKLSPDHRQVVLLAKYGGYTTAETAQLLGISESATKGRLHRALKGIVEFLEREGLEVNPDGIPRQ